jgi:hypothetical protein
MNGPFIGSEALVSNALTRCQLRSRYIALHPDVYLPLDATLTAAQRAYAAWLWSRRRCIVAGHSASALYGAKWIDDHAPAQLLYPHRRPPDGIQTWLDRVADHETQVIAGHSRDHPSAHRLRSRLPQSPRQSRGGH